MVHGISLVRKLRLIHIYPGSHFHDIMNHFPYYFLKSGQKTLPISLVYIFVALARRLGIDASPVDFPSRVIAYVAPVVPNDKPVYVDVFGSHAQAILSLESDIPLRLAAAGMPLTSISALVRPAPAAPMLLRATRNIYSSFGTHPLDGQSPAVSALASATYVAMCAIGVLGPGTRPVIDRLIDVIDRWPLDGRAVLVNALAPALDPDLQKLLREKVEKHIEEEDEKASRQYARDRETKLKFFVGQTFRHARYNYQAVIIGWTVCVNKTYFPQSLIHYI
jgi:F-box protein 21